jgi:futalosine hydrolase
MLKVLLVAASAKEINPITNSLHFLDRIDNTFGSYKYANLEIDVLVTGVGSIFTTYYLTQTLAYRSYDLVFNVGLAGSFDNYLELGYIVNVYQEQFADLGFEDKDKFFTIFEKELHGQNAFPFSDGLLRNNTKFELKEIKKLINVSAVTVNKIHGDQTSIQKTVKKFKAEIESMEGAAFFYVCMKEGLPFYEIRSISNFVETRRVDNWNIPLAIENLKTAMLDIFEELNSKGGE